MDGLQLFVSRRALFLCKQVMRKKSLLAGPRRLIQQLREYYRLIAWSAFILVLAAVVLRILHVLFTSLLLKLYSISFQHQLFRITYPFVSAGGKWTDARVFIVYVLGTLFILGMGLLLLRPLYKLRVWNVKLRLFLTWFAFLSAFCFWAAWLTGMFVNDELGLAINWFFPGRALQAAIAGALFVFSLFFRPLWISLFLKISGSRTTIETYGKKKIYFRMVFLWPFFAGTVFSLLLALVVGSVFWSGASLSMIFIALSLLVAPMPEKTPRLLKSPFVFTLSRKDALLMAGVLTGIFLAALFL